MQSLIGRTWIIVLFLAGCASIPDVTYYYYPATWRATITVTQSVGCNVAKTDLVTVSTPAVATAYRSDLESAPYKIRIKHLERAGSADIDFSMGFTEDGRLKSVNQSTTGQGEAVTKSIITLVAAVAATSAISITPLDALAGQQTPQCDAIQEWGGGKPVTLVYRATLGDDALDSSVVVEPAPESKALHKLLKDVLPEFRLRISDAKNIESGPRMAKQSNDDVSLTLQQIGEVDVAIFSSLGNDAALVGTSRIVVPLVDTYQLTIPKAALFGKQSFEITLAESGVVTSAGYGKSVGTSAALGAVNSIASTQTTATEAAELKAQADLILQQQRVVLCRTKPGECK
jgi:hypothetical protein